MRNASLTLAAAGVLPLAAWGCLHAPGGGPGDDDATPGPDDDATVDDDTTAVPDDDTTGSSADGDGDGSLPPDDCDDGDPAVHPGADESCSDGVDQDCDGDPTDCRLLGEVMLGEADAVLVGVAEDGAAGWWVGPAGDLDGDGLADLMIGAPNDSAGGWFAGVVHVVLGPVGAGERGLDTAEATIVAEDGSFGSWTAAGAWGADDTPMIALGAPWDGGGRVMVFAGPVDGVIGAEEADLVLIGEGESGNAGTSVADAGDVDGDGYEDLLIGAPGVNDGRGRAYLVRGPLPSGSLDLADADCVLTGSGGDDRAGEAVAGVGDLNSDGYADVLVGAPWHARGGNYAGAAFLLRGPLPTGLTSLNHADAVLYAPDYNWQAGAAVSGGGDLDGDSLPDLVVGAKAAENPGEPGTHPGAVFVFLGPGPQGDVALPDAHASLYGDDSTADAGFSVAGAGDVDGDGFFDLLVGAPARTGLAEQAGAGWIVYGPIPAGTTTLPAGGGTLIGEAPSDHAGRSVAGAGDVDGDGRDDVLVGAYGHDAGAVEGGAAYLFLGEGF